LTPIFTLNFATGTSEVFSFGQGAFGALGLGDTNGHATPQQIMSLSSSGIIGIAAGEFVVSFVKFPLFGQRRDHACGN
jgi:hypothetical protein